MQAIFDNVTDGFANLKHNARHLVVTRILTALVVGVASFALAIKPSVASLVLVSAPLAAIWLYSHFEQGLALSIAASLFIPAAIGTGTETSVPVSVILLGGIGAIWILDLAGVAGRQCQLPPWSILAPALAILFSVFISFLGATQQYSNFANLASTSAQIGGLGIVVISMLALLLSASVIKNEKWLRWLVFIPTFACVLYSAQRLITRVDFSFPSVIVSDAGGAVLWIWALVIPAGQAIYNASLSYRQRAVLLGVALFPSAVTIFGGYRDWASGWMPPLVGLGVLIMLKSRRLVILLIVPGAIFVLPQVLDAAHMVENATLRPDFGGVDRTNLASQGAPISVSDLIASDAYSVYTRNAAAEILLTKIFPLSPIIGLGPSNYYHYTPLYPILGYPVKFNSHNNYIDILLQYGLAGMGMVLWLFIAIFKFGRSLLQTRHVSGFENGYIYAGLAAIPAMAVAALLGDWIFPFVYNVGIRGLRASLLSWIFLGGMIALGQLRASQEKHVANA